VLRTLAARLDRGEDVRDDVARLSAGLRRLLLDAARAAAAVDRQSPRWVALVRALEQATTH